MTVSGCKLGYCEECHAVLFGVDLLDKTKRESDGRSYLMDCPVCKEERIFLPIDKKDI